VRNSTPKNEARVTTVVGFELATREEGHKRNEEEMGSDAAISVVVA